MNDFIYDIDNLYYDVALELGINPDSFVVEMHDKLDKWVNSMGPEAWKIFNGDEGDDEDDS